jgi:ADP-ribose pyrophosphatase YjhB (NUDIX family)
VSAGAIGVGCGAAILREGRILLVKRRKAPEAGCWSLVGGKVDFLERAEQAALRETYEEVGVALDLGPLLCLVQTIGVDGQHWVSPVYRASLKGGEPVNREPDKIAAIGWFALDDPPEPLALAAREAMAVLRACEGLKEGSGGPRDEKSRAEKSFNQ